MKTARDLALIIFGLIEVALRLVIGVALVATIVGFIPFLVMLDEGINIFEPILWGKL